MTLKDRRAGYLVEHIDALRGAFRTTRSERPFDIVAIAVLPDHLHAVLALPAGDADFSGRWRSIKGFFTRKLVSRGIPLIRNSKGEYDLWRRRFWEHTIQDDIDLERHVDYIHFNAVKHGIVRRARDWAYSSFRRYVKLGLLPANWGDAMEIASGSFGEPLD